MEGVIQYNLTEVHGALANCFIILINSLFVSIQKLNQRDWYPKSCHRDLLNEVTPTFDFIIVGGGAAGCTLAYHLSQVPEWNVLLLEAGDYPPASSEIPGFYYSFLRSEYDWEFQMEPSRYGCKAMYEGRCTLNRGKVLGGTSTINNLLYVRGFPDDFDKMAIPFWNSNITLEIFKHLENFTGKLPVQEYQFHYGNQGPIMLDLYNLTMPVKTVLKEIYQNSGMKRIPKRKFIGFTDHLVMSRNSTRYSMAKSLLSPIKEKENLFVSLNSIVKGINVGEVYDKRVKGVNVTIEGITFSLRAKKEVILAAGAINNAKLLLLSGVGPVDYLRRKKIKPVLNVPFVGQNLQLHVTVPMYFSIDYCNRNKDCATFDKTQFHADIFNYISDRSGNYGHVNLNEFTLYLNTLKTGITMPNLSVHHKFYKKKDMLLTNELEGTTYVKDVKRALIAHGQQNAMIVLLLTLMHPLSTGTVLLNDTNIYGNPKIEPNFFSDEKNADYDQLYDGWVTLTDLMLNDAAKKYKLNLLDVDVPACRNFKFCTKYYVNCYIKNMAYPLDDATGTAKMGNKCDMNTVVDDTLEVKSVRCLRIADSTVLPFIPSSTTIATDAMLAFRLSEILKTKWVKGFESAFDYNETAILEAALKGD